MFAHIARGSALFLFGLSMATGPAQAADRAARLKESLGLTGSVVPGVNRGWEGDPRADNWVSRCDRDKDAKACWLVGVELAPMSQYGPAWQWSSRPPQAMRAALSYLQRGCDLGSGEACADLGDFYRFKGDGRKQTHPDHRSDLTRAYGLYQSACAADSGYGCFVYAEFIDRGIGVIPDAAKAKGLFAELCGAGLPVACLRAKQPPAPAYRYKLYHAAKSSCGSSESCWAECKGGNWNSCLKVDYSARPERTLQPIATFRWMLDSKDEFYTVVRRACSEGSDWGCSGWIWNAQNAYATCRGALCITGKADIATIRNALAVGCKAGSESACLNACTMFLTELKSELQCATRRRTIAGVRFEDPTLSQTLRDCFEGGAQGCFELLPASSDGPGSMTSEEKSAYEASTGLFMRMSCNAGSGCEAMAQLYAAAGEPQRAWAYKIAAAAGRLNDNAAFAAFTPLERVMAKSLRGVINDDPEGLPDDMVEVLDNSCTQGQSRVCAMLAIMYRNQGYTSVTVPTAGASEADVLQWKKDLEDYAAASAQICGRMQRSGENSIAADIAFSKAVDRCVASANEHVPEHRKMIEESLSLARKPPERYFVVDPALKSRALGYYQKACSFGDVAACEEHSTYLASPNRIF